MGLEEVNLFSGGWTPPFGKVLSIVLRLYRFDFW